MIGVTVDERKTQRNKVFVSRSVCCSHLEIYQSKCKLYPRVVIACDQRTCFLNIAYRCAACLAGDWSTVSGCAEYFSSFLLPLDGVLLLEHSGVDQFMALLTICSTMPSRVDADVEGLNISGNSSQLSFSGTSSWSSPSSGWVARCSYQDSVMVFFVRSSS